MFLRDRVFHAAPDGALVLDERVEAVVGRFFLEQPVHESVVRSQAAGQSVTR
jgi:hypothetical protein